jgi:hypothetical protein
MLSSGDSEVRTWRQRLMLSNGDLKVRTRRQRCRGSACQPALSRGGVCCHRADLRWRPQVDLRWLNVGEPQRAMAKGGGPRRPLPKPEDCEDNESSHDMT